MNPRRFCGRLYRSIENGLLASSARTRTRDAKRRARFRPRAEALESRRVLSTFKVNTLLDTVAVNLQTGKDASGHMSLRSAIMAANAKPNADTIIVPGGTFKLTIPGANEDNAATGDLDIKGNVTIKGKERPGPSSTATTWIGSSRSLGQGADLGVDDPARPGRRRGGGLLNSGGQVTLTSVTIQNNQVSGANGSNGAAGLAGSDDGLDGLTAALERLARGAGSSTRPARSRSRRA